MSKYSTVPLLVQGLLRQHLRSISVHRTTGNREEQLPSRPLNRVPRQVGNENHERNRTTRALAARESDKKTAPIYAARFSETIGRWRLPW